MKGIICLWSGAVIDIPVGWHLCDGTEGTPNLQDKFIIGAGSTYNPGDTDQTNIGPNGLLEYYALCFIMKL